MPTIRSGVIAANTNWNQIIAEAGEVQRRHRRRLHPV